MAGIAEDAGNHLEEDSLPDNKARLFLLNLRELVKKSSSEMIDFILDYYKSDFLPLLKEKDSKKESMWLAITALGKACSGEISLPIYLNRLLLFISADILHIVINIQKHLVSLRKLENLEQLHLDALLNLSVFLKTFQLTLPSSSVDSVSILLPLMSDTCEKLLKQHKELYSTISDNLKLVDDEQQHFIQHHSLLEVRKLSKDEKLHLLEPPEDFRSLPILPTVDDVSLPCLFLRPNITKGRYKDTDHYLDVQFRLLREDYIKPLRDGIAEYLIAKKKNKALRSVRTVRVYDDVSISNEGFINGILTHKMHFQENYFSKLNWRSSKRLLTGNLLCLSTDNFCTMLFSTVGYRDPDLLKKGLLQIKFEDVNERVLNLNISDKFVVIEVPALFESYRHNLRALQLIKEESLPMKKYIVDLKKTNDRPGYLLPSTVFDMRPLFFPLEQNIAELFMSNFDESFSAHKYKSVAVMNDNDWPTATEINLDESQFFALKSAIMKEFALIQGPPGTGKTYLGLRAVQLLLHNLSSWFDQDSGTLPILVVCHTNHALDQFLEGILMLTKKIVRIGGRGSNESISRFQIKNLVRTAKKRREIPSSIRCQNFEAQDKIREIKRRMNNIGENTEKSKTDVFTESVLEDVILPVHFDSLKSYCHLAPLWEKISNERMYYWLEIDTFDEVLLQITSEKKLHKCDRAELEKLNERQNERKLQYIRNSMHNNLAMKNCDVLKIQNLWELPIHERWQLYKFWLEKFLESEMKEYLSLQEQLSFAFKELSNARNEEDLFVLDKAYVVGMTTTGAAKHRHIIEARNPVILIVEEAAQILESHTIASLTPKTQHVILIGDQQQLRPSPSVYMLALKYGMDVSLFERMINNSIDYCKLSIQHRMRPEIAALIVPHIYANLENHDIVTKFENIKGVIKNVFFVNHSFNELHMQDSKSKVNDHEAKFIVQFCKYLILQGYDPSKITVLTTYSGQMFALKRLATVGEVNKVRFTVVDNFQGEENDIILISFVRSNSKKEVGFLKVSNRICVALSRAKKGLYCIGNFTLLEEKSNLWKNIIKTLVDNKSIGTSLRLVCQNHPDRFTDVSKSTDFKAVPEGGCGRKCEYRLHCGHSCTRYCHPDDTDHKRFQCVKPCLTVCEQGHECPRKCYEDCKPCPTNVEKSLSKCGHTVTAWCGISEDKIQCREPCGKTCDAGHPCSKECYRLCGSCKVIVDKLLSRCNHTVKAECGKSEDEIKCQEPCKKTCDAGHPCPKECHRLCGSCKVIVDKLLLRCNHTVKAECGKSEDEIKCREPCKKTCDAGHPCPKECFRLCGSCKVIVDKLLSRCNHTVKAECSKSEDEIKCQEPCKKTCKEGHPCPKMCFKDCGDCEVIVDKFLSLCRHTVKAECRMNEFLIRCEEPCSKACVKGHPCPKKCFKDCGPCEFKLDKMLPKCGHTVNVLCSESESQIVCKNKCSKTCSKGHACQKLCYEMCGSCNFLVDKTLDSCGHTVEAPCSKPESEIKCTLQCKRILTCTHQCQNICCEPCTAKCLKLTEIQLPKCGHSFRVKCYYSKNLDELHKKCLKPCKEILACGHICSGICGVCQQGTGHVSCKYACKKILICGHKCVKKCGEPCSEQCMKVIPIKSSVCGHMVKIECGFSNLSYKLSMKCVEPCATILPCGHTCKGTCGSCYQGRLHVACNEACNRTLICGHKCVSKCCESCPPCEKPCRSRCTHGKCSRKCGEPCLTCTKPCDWSCSHKKCSRPCYEVCNRDPCNERCPKQLQCNHQCIGFCGETCPKECVTCDKRILREDALAMKSGIFDGYVYLEDCKHSFKLSYLLDYFTSNSSGMQRIFMKRCPQCKTVVQNNFRFNRMLKNDAKIIEKIKLIPKSHDTVNLDFQRMLLQRSNLLLGNAEIFYKKGIKLLSGGSVRNIRELKLIEHIWSFAKEIECKGFASNSSSCMLISKSFLEVLINYSHYCKEWVTNFICKNFVVVSEYQLQQLSSEIHRFQLLDFLLKLGETFDCASLPSAFEKCSLSLVTFAPFTDVNVKCFKKSLECFVNNLKDVPLKFHQPINVISMSGRWYQCSEEHIFCISGYDKTIVPVCYKCKGSSYGDTSTIRVTDADINGKSSLISESGSSVKPSQRLDDCPTNESRKSLIKNVVSKYPAANTDREVIIDYENVVDRCNKLPSSRTSHSNTNVQLSAASLEMNAVVAFNSDRDRASEKCFGKNYGGCGDHRSVSRSLNQVHTVTNNEKQLSGVGRAKRSSSRSISMSRQSVAPSKPFFSRSNISDNRKTITDASDYQQSYRKTTTSFTKQSPVAESSGGKRGSDPPRPNQYSDVAYKQSLFSLCFQQVCKKRNDKLMHGVNIVKVTKINQSVRGTMSVSESNDKQVTSHRVGGRPVKFTEIHGRNKEPNAVSKQSSSKGVFQEHSNENKNKKMLPKENPNEQTQNKRFARGRGRGFRKK